VSKKRKQESYNENVKENYRLCIQAVIAGTEAWDIEKLTPMKNGTASWLVMMLNI
jgi:hypothetical protein